MAIERSKRRLAARRLAEMAESLLEASRLCAIATVEPRGQAHINTAYFAWSSALEIIWISEPDAGHSRNLLRNEMAAIAVYDSSQTWGEPDRGIQLVGSARALEGLEAERAAEVYARRFPAFADARPEAYRVYRFRPRRLKLFDERVLGGGTFVTAAVARGGTLTWRKTEIYRGTIRR